jgi:hypothetical protein
VRVPTSAINEELKEQVRKFYAEDHRSIKAISVHTGLDEYTVSSVLREGGVPTRKKKHTLVWGKEGEV